MNTIFIMFGITLLLFLLDFSNCGLLSIYYNIKWRIIKYWSHEKEHEYSDWLMVDGGMRKIRFCKNCGYIDIH